METLDCRGLACPQPVIRAKKAMERLGPGGVVRVEVDNAAARENVRRFAEGEGASVSVEDLGKGGWRLAISRPAGGGPSSCAGSVSSASAVFITSEALGAGDERLGRILMEGFLSTLLEQDCPPGHLLLMNGGVRLAAEGSPAVPALAGLAERGCEILCCGTCLDFFGLRDALAAGRVSSMFEIQRILLEAPSVIRV